MRWRIRRLGVTQDGTPCVAAGMRISGSVGPRADAANAPIDPVQAPASTVAISKALFDRRGGIGAMSVGSGLD
jgi:hypothetical protein